MIIEAMHGTNNRNSVIRNFILTLLEAIRRIKWALRAADVGE